MALAGEQVNLHGNGLAAEGLGHRFGLGWGHHLVVQALKKDHRAANPLRVLQGGSGRIGGLGGRPGADQTIEIAGFKAMGLAGQRAQISDAVPTGPGAKDIRKAQGSQGGEAPRAAAFDGDAGGRGPSLVHHGLGRGGTVGHIDNPPLAIEALAVGPAKAGGAAVIHIDHSPAAAGPKLNGQAQAGAGHARGAAVALHQQRGLRVAAVARGVKPGLGGLFAMAREPQLLGLADGCWIQGAGGGWRVLPEAAGDLQLQEA